MHHEKLRNIKIYFTIRCAAAGKAGRVYTLKMLFKY